MNINISNWLLEEVDSASLVQNPITAYVPSSGGIMPTADDGADGGGTYTKYSKSSYYNYNNKYYNYDNYGDYSKYSRYSDYSDYSDYGDYGDYGNYANQINVNSSPSAQTINEGNIATFTFSVSTGSSVGSKKYQWYYSTTATGSGTAISGATSATYKITGSATNHGRYYYCVFSSSAGNRTSSRALLTVNIYRAYDIYVAVGSTMQIPTASNNTTKSITACSIKNSSLASITTDGVVTGNIIGSTTVTVTIGGTNKTINVYVVENKLEALFATLAIVIRAKNKNSTNYYPNQLLNGFVNNTTTSKIYTSLEALLSDLANNIRTKTSSTATLRPYQFAKKIAETITSF